MKIDMETSVKGAGLSGTGMAASFRSNRGCVLRTSDEDVSTDQSCGSGALAKSRSWIKVFPLVQPDIWLWMMIAVHRSEGLGDRAELAVGPSGLSVACAAPRAGLPAARSSPH